MTQRGRNSCRGDFCTVPPHDAFIRSDPKLFVLQDEQAVDLVIELSFPRGKNPSSAHIEETFVLGTEPHLAVRGLSYRNDHRVGCGKAVSYELRGPTEAGVAIVGFGGCGAFSRCSVGGRSENFKSSATFCDSAQGNR